MNYSAEGNLVFRHVESGAVLIVDGLGVAQPAEGYEILDQKEAAKVLKQVNADYAAALKQIREDAKEDARLAKEREVAKHSAFKKLLKLGLDPVEATAITGYTPEEK